MRRMGKVVLTGKWEDGKVNVLGCERERTFVGKRKGGKLERWACKEG